ncbi:hypothetical protein KUCAC02_006040 [Chaenocephalus aceratus]|uniref:Uncharacterized protein n=1 Tax=Chaenocephalus aceratus TaxID=36190 RepID=A0ACB9WQW6_CHAAC|nr:hypothetical protein KUCAC02_006040 [Chaenocephalus aceratus]
MPNSVFGSCPHADNVSTAVSGEAGKREGYEEGGAGVGGDEETREEEMLGKEVTKSGESWGNRGRKWQGEERGGGVWIRGDEERREEEMGKAEVMKSRKRGGGLGEG